MVSWTEDLVDYLQLYSYKATLQCRAQHLKFLVWNNYGCPESLKVKLKVKLIEYFFKRKRRCFKRRGVTREPREEKVQIKRVEEVLVWL